MSARCLIRFQHQILLRVLENQYVIQNDIQLGQLVDAAWRIFISSLNPQCLTEPKQACPAAAVVDYMLGMVAIVMFRRRDQCC